MITGIENLIDEIFDYISNKYSKINTKKYKEHLKFVYQNEDKYKAQYIMNIVKAKKHTMDGEISFENKDILFELNFYEAVNNIFNEIYENYDCKEDMIKLENDLLETYEKNKKL